MRRDQTHAEQLPIIAHKEVFVGKGRRGPRVFGAEERKRGLDQRRPTEFLISAGNESGSDEFAPIVEDESRITVRRDLGAGSPAEPRDLVGLPYFPAAPRSSSLFPV
jgi:hypothetical protein